MTEREYKADLKRIEQIKEELEKLRIEKVKLIQRTYYYEHKDKRKNSEENYTNFDKNS